MRAFLATALIGAGLACAQPAAAAPAAGAKPVLAAGVEADARCFLITSAMVAAMAQKEGGGAAAGLLMVSASYYMGKLAGRIDDHDLEDLLVGLSSTLTPQAIEAEAKRCGDELSERGKAMTAIGEDMIRRGASLKPNV